jgi:hypothetical protein
MADETSNGPRFRRRPSDEIVPADEIHFTVGIEPDMEAISLVVLELRNKDDEDDRVRIGFAPARARDLAAMIEEAAERAV